MAKLAFTLSTIGLVVRQQRAEQLPDLLRAVAVGLEVPEIGAAVAVLLAGDLGRRHFLHQRRGTADHHVGREHQRGDPVVQRVDVGHQLVGVLVQAGGAVVDPQPVLDPVEAGEARVLLGLLMVVGARIHGAVEIAEQLGDRLDRLVVGAGRREQRLGLVDVAGLDRGRERLRLRDQLGRASARRRACIRRSAGPAPSAGPRRAVRPVPRRATVPPVRWSVACDKSSIPRSWLPASAGCSRAALALQQGAAEIVLGRCRPRQGEEIAAADRLEILLQRLAIEALLDGDEALLQIGLVADEQKAHVELARLGHSVRIVERPAQDQVLRRFRRARIGQPDMRVQAA